tara:strand:+ start:2070 stop:2276 length:207 start_codon:yes stop_codon:yes gene_type:complete
MEHIEIKLNQRQANLVLRALELLEEELHGLEGREDREDDGSRLVCRQLWNTICTMGLDAHFGKVKNES